MKIETVAVRGAGAMGHGRRLPVTGPFLSADMGGLDIFPIISTYLFPTLYAEVSRIDRGEGGNMPGITLVKSSATVQLHDERKNLP